jgi:hypothetical protein
MSASRLQQRLGAVSRILSGSAIVAFAGDDGGLSETSARLVAAHQSERYQVDERRQLAPISASSDVTPRRRSEVNQLWAACSGGLLPPKAPQVIVVCESFLKGWRAMR